MTFLTDQQRLDLLAAQGAPLPVVDADTQQVYYLISSEQYQQLRERTSAEPFAARELYPLIAKTADEAGWSDPRMDDYDRYDEIRREG